MTYKKHPKTTAASEPHDLLLNQLFFKHQFNPTKAPSKQLRQLMRCLISSTFQDSRVAISANSIAQQLNLSEQEFTSWISDLEQHTSLVKLVNADYRFDPLKTSSEALIYVEQGKQDETKLYLGRYWLMRQMIFHRLKGLTALAPCLVTAKNSDLNQAETILCQHGWLAISGAAGTGKSTLALRLIEQLLANKKFTLALITPTAKAAARLNEAINNHSEWRHLAAQPIRATTIHAALGKRPHCLPKYNSKHQWPYDLLVIDEASMLSWELMNEILQATPTEALIIFMGDVNQLSAIGVGGCYAELIEQFPQQVLKLKQQHRFSKRNEIQQLAAKALQGRLLRSSLAAPHYLQLIDAHSAEQLRHRLQVWCDQHFASALQLLKQQPINGDQDRLEPLYQSLVISPWRVSIQGVNHLNRIMQRHLYKGGHLTHPSEVCEGLPVVIRANIANLDLYNGDRGVVVSVRGELKLKLPNQGGYYSLPSKQFIDPALAMTVFQTQGSEFDNVLLWLGEMNSFGLRWLDEKVLYTSVTRAKKTITILGCLPNQINEENF